MGVQGKIFATAIHTNILMWHHLEFPLRNQFFKHKLYFYNVCLRRSKYIIYKNKYDLIPKRKKANISNLLTLNHKKKTNLSLFCKYASFLDLNIGIDDQYFKNITYVFLFSQIL